MSELGGGFPPVCFLNYRDCLIVFSRNSDYTVNWIILGDDWRAFGVSSDLDHANFDCLTEINKRTMLQ